MYVGRVHFILSHSVKSSTFEKPKTLIVMTKEEFLQLVSERYDEITALTHIIHVIYVNY